MCPQLDPREVDSVILERAMAQHGVVSRAQLREAGIADGSLKHRPRRGRLHRLHRGVYAVGHPMLTWEGRLMAALLACGGGAVASHRTAGDVWGLRPSARRKVDVTVPSHAGRAPPGTVSLHRSTTLLEWERTLERGIPVTTPARTLLDIAALMDRRSLKGTRQRVVVEVDGRRHHAPAPHSSATAPATRD